MLRASCAAVLRSAVASLPPPPLQGRRVDDVDLHDQVRALVKSNAVAERREMGEGDTVFLVADGTYRVSVIHSHSLIQYLSEGAVVLLWVSGDRFGRHACAPQHVEERYLIDTRGRQTQGNPRGVM